MRAASAAASSREPTPSFIRTRCTWVRAVLGAIPIPAAMSRVSSPSATRTSTSTSRGVSIRSSRCPSSSGVAAGFSSSVKAPWRSCGATAASPARAFMMARSTPSMRSSCRTYPDAPAAKAAAMPRGLGTGPRTTTATCGRSRLMRTTGSKAPGSAGVAVPSRQTSGARLTTSSAAPAAGAAAASTRCPRSFSAEASASANRRWSSTTIRRTPIENPQPPAAPRPSMTRQATRLFDVTRPLPARRPPQCRILRRCGVVDGTGADAPPPRRPPATPAARPVRGDGPGRGGARDHWVVNTSAR
ncbi:hypothetical protein BG846_01907 [Streptomyces fradiae ATCC 10745 = DSM 40063]|uniref:Uncharacterized protein n=1 Tax=Streptomyces fradiae ATCC 10745 = DSM 40063 TaxID=1319510 RepID=A0A1Y2NZM3_STRFR|nr:hypothetical protein BG846_01907 [Streptomyces fradiae ATCC 10745 = DSM 40063]